MVDGVALSRMVWCDDENWKNTTEYLTMTMTTFISLTEFYYHIAQQTCNGDAADAQAGRRILTGTLPRGVRYAVCGARRLKVYAEGGVSEERFVEGIGWVMEDDDPSCVWEDLYEALGVTFPS